MHGHFGHHRHERHSRHGFGGMRGPAGGHRRGGRIGRFLEHGDLRFVILALIAEQPRHGYELIKALEERSGGAYRPSPGVIYPTLSLLEDEGFIAQAAGDTARKLYELTAPGKTALDDNRPGVEAVFARMADAAAGSEITTPRIARAMGNLGLSLKHRLARQPITPEELEVIVDAIDAAAKTIEKS